MVDVSEALAAALAAKPTGGLLPEEVGPEEIAAVVARWTGIPVARLQQVGRKAWCNVRR